MKRVTGIGAYSSARGSEGTLPVQDHLGLTARMGGTTLIGTLRRQADQGTTVGTSPASGTAWLKQVAFMSTSRGRLEALLQALRMKLDGLKGMTQSMGSSWVMDPRQQD